MRRERQSKRRRRLTQAELRAIQATPGLIVRRIPPDGRAKLEQLAPESFERRRDFARRLADDTPGSEGSEPSS